MDPLLRTALWQQFGATIDTLENALLACPSTYWHGRLWSDHSDHPLPPKFAELWYITYHTLFWLDLYLTGSLEGFAPPTPFTLDARTDLGAATNRFGGNSVGEGPRAALHLRSNLGTITVKPM